jgi:hypothetical protein
MPGGDLFALSAKVYPDPRAPRLRVVQKVRWIKLSRMLRRPNCSLRSTCLRLPIDSGASTAGELIWSRIIGIAFGEF